MSVGQRVASDHQLARLLQIGVVLEEVVEARSTRHHRELDGAFDAEIEALLTGAAEESADHRRRLEELIDELDADSVSYEEIEALVEAQYGQTKPEDFDGLLYDQLCNEETAYKFYDDLIAAIEGSDSEFSVDRERVLETLRGIRAEEAEGVEEITGIMERR
ncbi:ferritin-like domain-containing protein [Halobaculum sp. CBA1158]|uniref:ferritin-like domain-containing protein n=1 Tax=Halobaculum sp. CBA1158 TaxID=2904243 RepID=UPI001F48C233|nr:ferritin-like domain-containing protein [Halobaculum sp. CBA1158]UIP00843.1 ferritin-like domain-containing protein [Halobaculum sp. CBA1158]